MSLRQRLVPSNTSEKPLDATLPPFETSTLIPESSPQKKSSDAFPDRICSFIPQPVTSRYFQRKISDAEFSISKILNNDKIRGRIFMALFAASFFTRFYNLSEPHSVVFDEVHFGGFASKYLQRRYFFDVHPPTAKLLLALVGYLAGYSGEYTFKEIGMDYTKSSVYVPYFAMRCLPAFLNTLMVPLTFLTMLEFGFSSTGAILASIMVLLETSFITQSRFILLDSFLLFFLSCTLFSFARFMNCRRSPFSHRWWIWLALTGTSLGLTVSVKWVGLFLIALIGIHTLKDLWNLLAETRQDFTDWILHFLARLVCLILLPVLIYVFSYYIHFSILTISGSGNNFMSQDFRDGLHGVVPLDTSRPVTNGSSLILKNDLTGGYLHSHPHMFPSGSQQQQVTVYGFEDHNNWFTLDLLQTSHLKNNSLLRLSHFSTEKGLYSHGFPAPVSGQQSQNGKAPLGGKDTEDGAKPSKDAENLPGGIPSEDIQFFEVSAHFEGGHEWKIQLLESNVPETIQKDTRFRLIRTYGNVQCALHNHKVLLPAWGFNQQEVTCNRNLSDPGTVWYISGINANRIEEYDHLTPPIKDRSGFFYKITDIINIQKISWDANSRISSEHPFGSRPYQWPILHRGISFYADNAKFRQIYLLGNPLQYWIMIPALFCYLILSGIYILRARRGCKDLTILQQKKYFFVFEFLLLGWILHYFPFWLMTRQLFLHHYLPCHFFSILFFASLSDLLLENFSSSVKTSTLTIFFLVFFYGFLKFSPICYGFFLPKSEVDALKWLPTWDFSKY